MFSDFKTNTAIIATAAFTLIGALATPALSSDWEEDTLAFIRSLQMNLVWSIDDTATLEEIEQSIENLLNPAPVVENESSDYEEDDGC